MVEISEKGKKKAAYPSPILPRQPEIPEERRWPSPTPLPIVPTEDVNRVLKQMLDRLDAIEKRLGNIEKLLMKTEPV